MHKSFCIYKSMCRLCLDALGTHDVPTNGRLIQDIFMCTGILQISVSDGLPPRICSECSYKIEIAMDLRNYATNNDLYVRSILDTREKRDPSLVFLFPKVSTRRPLEESSVQDQINKNNVLITHSDIQYSTSEERNLNTEQRKRKNENNDLVTPPVQKSRISVRSLADINSGVPPLTAISLTKHNPSQEKKSIAIQTETSNVPSEKKKTIAIQTDIPKSPTEKKRKTKAIQTDISNFRTKIKQKTKAIQTEISNNPTENSTSENNNECDSSSTKDKNSIKEKNKSNCDSSSYNNKNEISEEYKCEVCKKIYKTSKKLYLHKRSHSKKLYCPLDACCKHFATKGDLQKHIRSHTGEKPYACDLCDKKFTQNVSLKAHKKAVHGPKCDKQED